MLENGKMSFETFVDGVNDFIKWFVEILKEFIDNFKKKGPLYDPTAVYGE